jgi:hypothetical protein
MVMRRLLTGYSGWFNKKYNGHGQLFHNRYKSILCQEDPYLQELVRYIQLNPLRAKLVHDLKELNTYPWCGHSVVMNKTEHACRTSSMYMGCFPSKKDRPGKHINRLSKMAFPKAKDQHLQVVGCCGA